MSTLGVRRHLPRRVLRGLGLGTMTLTGALAAGFLGGWSNPGSGQPVVLGLGTSAHRSPLRSVGSQPVAASENPGTFRISGAVAGLYPGATVSLNLTVANPEPFAITVSSLVTTVSDASASCPAANLTVGSFSGHLPVPALGQAATSVPATLKATAPDSCIGAAFPLVYSGLANKASK